LLDDRYSFDDIKAEIGSQASRLFPRRDATALGGLAQRIGLLVAASDRVPRLERSP
jgi:hypothetical protein